jgi:mRNA-degrading endonuclease RelE of RelBE toxin-antitoxin system/PHD/YefM family antitoxin component YafN of YafNO toxin-antitoxin module
LNVKRLDIHDLSDEARALVAESEVSGGQTLFERNGRPVAMLVSYDEYLALRETIEIANDPMLYARLEEADQEAREEQFSSALGGGENDRLRFPRIVEEDWSALNAGERELAGIAFASIDDDPITGAPLFEPLKGLWSHRTGTIRIVYRIVAEAKYVLVLAVKRASSSLS